MKCARVLLVVLVVSFLAVPAAQAPDDTKIWQEFVAWLNAQPDVNQIGPDRYKAKLLADGMTPAQADQRIAALGRLTPQHRDEIGVIYFNKLYATPGQTRFTPQPNAFLVEMTKGLKPGTALDVGIGQGRNAIYLASQGWDVTGYDVAEDGLKVAEQNAVKAGTSIKTVKARFDDFDYGTERWDLIYFVYVDAPITDPAFIAKVSAGLKKGGLLLIDRPFHPLDKPQPGWPPPTDQDKVNALPKAWSNLQLVRYDDTFGIADWQQTREPREVQTLRLVKMLARKW